MPTAALQHGFKGIQHTLKFGFGVQSGEQLFKSRLSFDRIGDVQHGLALGFDGQGTCPRVLGLGWVLVVRTAAAGEILSLGG